MRPPDAPAPLRQEDQLGQVVAAGVGPYSDDREPLSAFSAACWARTRRPHAEARAGSPRMRGRREEITERDAQPPAA